VKKGLTKSNLFSRLSWF